MCVQYMAGCYRKYWVSCWTKMCRLKDREHPPTHIPVVLFIHLHCLDWVAERYRRSDVCLLSHIIELDGISPTVLKASKIHYKIHLERLNSSVSFQKSWAVIHDKLETLLRAVSHGSSFLSTEPHTQKKIIIHWWSQGSCLRQGGM